MRMPQGPRTYPNPRGDDPWDHDAVEWLLHEHPEVAREFTRGSLFECARRQPQRVRSQPKRVERAAEICRQYGVEQLAVFDPVIGRRVVRLRRTDPAAPLDYPDYDAMTRF
jgi:hypothetical protein